VDDILCSWDWCGGTAQNGDGQCSDHEWKKCGTPEGVCVISVCDPANGECTPPVRNGNACCPNSVINFGEECEAGLNGADKQCCKECMISHDGTPCDDNNPCTSEQCLNARCTSTFKAGPCPGPEDTDTCANYMCVANADPTVLGTCERVPDASVNGKKCGEKPSQCTVMVCQDGTCVEQADQSALGQPCTDSKSGSVAPTCMKYVCGLDSNGQGECQAVVDLTQTCPNQDNDLCTSEKCVANAKKGTAACAVVDTVVCDAQPVPQCFAAGTCDPKTGKCPALIPLSDEPCQNGTRSDDPRGGACQTFTCAKGVCLADCSCGNGILEQGEECDWAIPHQDKCCDKNCKGCLCGNGRLDPQEQCDYNIPSQASCCSKDCVGCLCGNGRLDANETCDPAFPQHAQCCDNVTCQGCEPVSHAASAASSATIAIGAAAAALVVVGVAAAIFAVTKAAAGAGAAAAPASSFAGGAGAANPLYVGNTSAATNVLYSPPT
jgi:hypothetical protein